MKRPYIGERYRKRREGDDDWPLHVNLAGTLDLAAVTRAAQTTTHAQAWSRALTALSVSTYSGIPLNKPGKCALSEVDTRKLLEVGLFTKIERLEVKQWASLWALPEVSKRRRRLILWPQTLNHWWRTRYGGEQSAITDCVNHFDVDRHFVPLDMPAAFYQVELPPQLRAYFAVDTPLGPLAITRLPMGASFAPEILQLLLKIAVEQPQPGRHATHLAAVHVDNVLLSSANAQSVQEASLRLQSTLQRWGGRITVDTAAVINDHTGCFCGAVFDTERHVFKVKQKTVDKILSPRALHTVADHRENISRLMYASRILRVPMSHYYAVLKYTRKLYSALTTGRVRETDALPEMWEAARREYRSWVAVVRKNAWTHHPKRTLMSSKPPTYLFTDASLSGWGAVLIPPRGAPRVYRGSWPEKHEAKEMTVLEMRALVAALRAAGPPMKKVHHLQLVVDNTAVKAVLRKGGAFCYDLNAGLRQVQALLPERAMIEASYIATALMPADDPSRGRVLERAKLEAALEHLKLRRGPEGEPEGRTRDCVSRVRYARQPPP